VTSVLPKNFDRALLALLGGHVDQNIYATVPEAPMASFTP
jgi:hypothetical protein